MLYYPQPLSKKDTKKSLSESFQLSLQTTANVDYDTFINDLEA
jgi:hypothetical protein